MLYGYSTRDDSLEDMMSRYNDDFPKEEELRKRIENVFAFIDECGFQTKSRIWKKADFYTTFLELDQILNIDKKIITPSHTIAVIEGFFEGIDTSENTIAQLYYKSALQASNDKGNRVRRGIILGGLLRSEAQETRADLFLSNAFLRPDDARHIVGHFEKEKVKVHSNRP